MTVGREIEVKLRVESAAAGRRALEALGAARVVERHFEDNVLLDLPDGRLRARDSTLRLRTTDGTARLTYKGPRRIEEGAKSREEIECRVDEPATLQAVLEHAGMEVLFRYQKYREEWRWQDVALVLDETPIGTFIEIEGPLAGIHRAARAMGRSPDEYLHDSYPALFRACFSSGDMVFPA